MASRFKRQPIVLRRPTHRFSRRREKRERGKYPGEISTGLLGRGEAASARTRETPHRSRARIGATILAITSHSAVSNTPVQAADFRERSRRAETPEQRPTTFDGRRRTGEKQPAAPGWELVYLTDAGVLDAASWGDQAGADQCARAR